VSTLLGMLPLELQEITEYIEPNSPVERNETVIGHMTDDHKKLYTLWLETDKWLAELKLEFQFRRRKEDDERRALVGQLLSKSKVLKLLFWAAISDEFGLWGHDITTGVREGYTVVEFKDEPKGLPDFFHHLMGDD